jgi:hypothetical protein
MRAHYLSVRSISGDSVAPYRLQLFSFQIQVVPLPLQLGFQDPLRNHLQDRTISPILRVLPTLRCIPSLALRHVRYVRHTASPLFVEGTLVECGDFSSMVGA